MKKILVFSFLVFVTLSQARVVNAIAIAVNGEPITTEEIKAVQKQLHVSKKEAEDMLIENRLQKAAMRGVVVSEDEIDERIKLIAKQNNISVKKMQKILKKQGQSWSRFRKQIKTSIQKQKFFKSKIAPTIPTPTEDQLRIYYRNHPELFSMPSSITVMEYSASSPAKIQAMLRNHAHKKGIKSKKVTFSGSDLTPQLLAMIAQTPKGSFTPAFNTGSAYVTYKILHKGKGKLIPFEEAKNRVMTAWQKEQMNDAIKRYFKRMRTGASIEYIRR
jgi:hypothetical protein